MAIAVVMCFIQAFTQGKKEKKYIFIKRFYYNDRFVGIMAYTPFSPFLKNMGLCSIN